MPRYTYECQNEQCQRCHLIIEEKRSVEDRNKESFCECGQKMVRLTDLPANPIFRGDGFTPKFHR